MRGVPGVDALVASVSEVLDSRSFFRESGGKAHYAVGIPLREGRRGLG